MAETIDVRLARIEEMLKAHLGRVDERCARSAEKMGVYQNRLDSHSVRLDDLETFQSRIEGGWHTLAIVSSVSAAAGGLAATILGMAIK